LEQYNVSAQCKQNSKKFWNYVKNKSSVRSEISDIIIEQDGAQKELTEIIIIIIITVDLYSAFL